MNDIIPSDSARIRALKTSMVSLLELDREERISTAQVEQGAKLLIEAFQDILNIGSKQLVQISFDRVGGAIRAIEDAYADWRDIDRAFTNTLHLAYNAYIPRENLLLDSVYSLLSRRIGEPISALYTRLHAAWEEHLVESPWDAFIAENTHDTNEAMMDDNLKLLVHGDHLDVEDAVEKLTSDLRYAFANYLQKGDDSLDMLEESLWMRPEIVVINDYWRYRPKVKILDVLGRKASKFSGSFARVQDFFSNAAQGAAKTPEEIVQEVQSLRPEQKEPYFRCLMLHPDQQIRRYAVNNVDLEGFWTVVTPQAVPCATILNMLERVAGTQMFDEDFQKIFFQTVHRRLLSLTSRSEVIYARGIVRIFAQLPFFMEDEYFEKLRTIIDYLSAKEKMYKLADSVLDEHLQKLRREKDKIGTLRAQSPNLTSIPPVVLRKLARDGHYWYELAMHPMFKIARETVPHVNSQDRALRVANNHMVSQDVIREIGRNRALFKTLPARLALLSNPRTPPNVSLSYLPDLGKGDAEVLLRKSTLHPELRSHLRNRMNA